VLLDLKIRFLGVVREIASPTRSGSISPRVTAMFDGSLLLSWLEPENDKMAKLRYSFWRDGIWSEPATIAEGLMFSRHPSESPGVVALSQTNLMAYWSQRPSDQKGPASMCTSPFQPTAVRTGPLQR
jgi:hypothetical protein